MPIEPKPTRPLFSYYGGKQRMAKRIVDLLPRHTVYVEPFAGGAAVFFKKPWPPATNTHHYREVLNDVDNRIVNLYRVVGDPELFDQFFRLVATPCARTVHVAAKQRNKSCDIDVPDIQAAVDYYVNVQQSFGNILHGGWGTGVYGRNLAATWGNKIKALPQCLDRLIGVHVECDDAIEIIKRWDSQQTLFYCDPPYPGADQGDYGGYTQEDFARLCDALDGCQSSFALSNYNNPGPRSHWDKHEFQAYCSVSCEGMTGNQRDRTKQQTTDKLGNRKRTECLWVVDRSANARKEIHAIWEKWGWQEGVGMGNVEWIEPKGRKRK